MTDIKLVRPDQATRAERGPDDVVEVTGDHERPRLKRRRLGRVALERRSFSFARAGLLLLLAAAAAGLVVPGLVRSDLPDDPALLGTPARSFVRADRDYVLVDEDATAALRRVAADHSPTVWDLDVGRGQRDVEMVRKGLERLRQALEPAHALV